MPNGMREVELRLEGAADAAHAVATVVGRLDPAATARLDSETGIVHLKTGLDTLEVIAALAGAGYDATAMTG